MLWPFLKKKKPEKKKENYYLLLAAPFKVRKERAKACCIPFEVFDYLADV